MKISLKSLLTRVSKIPHNHYKYFINSINNLPHICNKQTNKLTLWSHQKQMSLIKTKIIKAAIFNKENIGKLERNKD